MSVRWSACMDRGMLFSRRIQSPIPYLENHVLAYAKFDWSEFRFDIVLRIMKSRTDENITPKSRIVQRTCLIIES